MTRLRPERPKPAPTTTVEKGFRWMKNPAAINPVWLEKRPRIAALAMLTVVGLLVVFESFASVTRVELSVEGMAISQIHGWQAHHELICQALELDALIYENPMTQENYPTMRNDP
jgi:transposase